MFELFSNFLFYFFFLILFCTLSVAGTLFDSRGRQKATSPLYGLHTAIMRVMYNSCMYNIELYFSIVNEKSIFPVEGHNSCTFY